MESRREGLTLAIIAVCLWAMTTGCIVLGGQRIEKFEFLAISCFIAGIVQLGLIKFSGRSLSFAFKLPWWSWFGLVLPFVIYGVIYPIAILFCKTPQQTMTANLLNYMWPCATMLIGAIIVPTMKLTFRLGVSVLFSIIAVACANIDVFLEGQISSDAILPYSLAIIAALLWGLYSALLCRRQKQAASFSSVPVSFLILGVIFAIVATVKGQWKPIDFIGILILVFYAVGPFSIGYRLWELAPVKGATSTAMGLLASSIPITSTVCLCVIQQKMPGMHILLAAAFLSIAAAVSVKRKKKIQPMTLPEI